MRSRRRVEPAMLRGAAVLLAVGGLAFIGSRLEPPSRGAQYDDSLNRSLAPAPAAPRPHPNMPDYMRNPEEGKRHAEALVRKAGGDFSRLAPEEQQWLNALTAGHGAEMVRKRAAALRAQDERAR